MLRFLFRLVGLAGLFAAGVGGLGLLALPADDRGRWFTAWLDVTIVGGAVALLVFAFELIAGMRQSAGRRSAAGSMVLLQVVLAVVLLIGVNAFSIFHYLRWDTTRSQEFSRTQPKQLGADLAEQLKQLRGETTVVIYQQHKTFGRFSDKPPDAYDAAADRKVVEKVKDLVQELREYGSRFRVVTLDVKEEDFDGKLAEEAKRFPRLKEAVAAAPENSIFFCTPEHIQRLGFSEYYQLDKTASRQADLDKTASQQADHGRGNLVLLDQGVEPFLRRVLAIEERKPRIGIVVTHPWLDTEGPLKEYSLSGLRKALEHNGFEVRDIILKKFQGSDENMSLETAAYSNEESKYDELEARVTALREQIADVENVMALLQILKSSRSLDEVNKELSTIMGRPVTMSAAGRRESIANLESEVEDEDTQRELEQWRQRERSLTRDLEKLSIEERVTEGRRQSDVKKKMARLLEDCDLLIVARMTLRDAIIRDVIPQSLHRMDEVQVAAIKDYLKAGKPVFLCVGPTNSPPRIPDMPSPPQPDSLEDLFAELGLFLAPQTVLFNSENEAYAVSQVISFGGAGKAEIPPLEFEDESGKTKNGSAVANPIAASLKLTSRSVGEKLDLRMRYPRPMQYQSLRAPATTEPAFLVTSPESWNEDQPFPSRSRLPAYKRKKPVQDKPSANDKEQADPAKGTWLERRRGPFVVGLAVETVTPIEWYDERYEAAKAAQLALAGLQNPGGLPLGIAVESFQPAELWAAGRKADAEHSPHRVRIAAVGQGHWIAGTELSPASETLIVDTCNWLLRRDDRLPRAKQTWEYPRVQLSPRDQGLWRWSMFLGLPWTITCVGLVVLMVRRMR